MKVYHGTSAEAAERILVDGFGCNEETVWNCSDNGSTYFWAHAVDRIEGEGVSRAFESGLVTAAMRGSLDKRVIVFELDIPDEFVGNWVLEDHSCEGMAGAWVVSSNWLNARLNESAVTLRVFVREIYRPDFRWFYLTGAAEELLNLTDEEAASLHLAKRLSNDGILCSELFEETRLNANCA